MMRVSEDGSSLRLSHVTLRDGSNLGWYASGMVRVYASNGASLGRFVRLWDGSSLRLYDASLRRRFEPVYLRTPLP